MSDSWLMGDDPAENSYLGMDDPAMPDGAPAPPSAPTAVATAEPAAWGSGDADDDWLGGTSSAPPDPMAHPSAPADDDDWLAASAPQHGGQPAVTPGAAPALHAEHPPQYAQQHQQQHQQYAQPAPPTQLAASVAGDISVTSPQLPQVQRTPRRQGGPSSGAVGELSGLVLDVEVDVEVGLGNAALTVEEFLEMGRGSVVELDTPIDSLIELKVRGKLIARGQLVSINGSYGMRIVEMLNEEH